jgi:hypothetical protein
MVLQTDRFQNQKIERNKLLYQVRFMEKSYQVELKSPLIPLCLSVTGRRLPKGETLIPLPFIKGGGEGLTFF